MSTTKLIKNKIILAFIAGLLVLAYVITFSPFSKANFVLDEKGVKIIYADLGGSAINRGIITNATDSNDLDRKIEPLDEGMHAYHSKSIFLSPNREFLAITIEPYNYSGVGIKTYITDTSGQIVTQPYPGSFIAWSPDSQKVLVYRSFEVTQTERQIYYLSINGEYYDSGLPGGVTGADISNDGSIVYTLTSTQSDDTKIYLRDLEGKDNLLVDGNNSILAWVRWSPEGDKIAYMQSDLAGRPGNQSIWIMDLDGSDQQMLSGVIWNYPPIWSPDGNKLAFGNSGNIWEYNVSERKLNNLTNFKQGIVEQPAYSMDGNEIVFISDSTGKRQVWIAGDGKTLQLTDSSGDKDYPVLLE